MKTETYEGFVPATCTPTKLIEYFNAVAEEWIWDGSDEEDDWEAKVTIEIEDVTPRAMERPVHD